MIKDDSVYYDTRSHERATGKTKPKYKLAGPTLLDQYIFDVLTRNKDACKERATIEINASHWIDRDGKFSSKETSYCDITKYEVIPKDKLLIKLRDLNNGFRYRAKLCPDKRRERHELKKNIHSIPRISDEAIKVIELGINASTAKLKHDLNL